MISRLLTKCLQNRSLAVALIKHKNQVHLREISTNVQCRKFSTEDEHVDFTADDTRPILQSVVLKDFMPSESNDPIIKKIRNCCTIEEASKYLETIQSSMDSQQLLYFVLTLGELNKTSMDSQHLNLALLITRLDELLDTMLLREACIAFHYLNNLGVSIKNSTMERITDKVLKEVAKEENFSLVNLMHFTATLNSDKGLYSSYLAVATLPQVNQQLENCSSVEDFYLLTIILTNISSIISTNVLDTFKKKIEEFLDKDLLNETTPKPILKAINFLNYPHWSFKNVSLIRRLLLELEENISLFETWNLVTMNKAFQSQLESAKLVPLLVKRAQKLLKETPSIELLSLAVLQVTPDQRTKIAAMVSDILASYQISSSQSSDTLQTVFKILRLLKISDIPLCDTYWGKAINEIYSTKDPNLNYTLSRYIHKYTYFNNNLGGTYRHLEFEKSIIDILNVEIKNTMNPHDFANYCSFLIAFGDGSHQKRIPKLIVDKIEALNEQFNIKDCLHISRGLQIMHEVRFRRPYSGEFFIQVDSINFSLDKSARRHLKTKNLHLRELNGIIRAFNNRRGTTHSSLFHNMIQRYETGGKLDLDSRSVREISYNLVLCNFRIDPICDQFVDYILENWDHVTGETVEKILSCCYNFSYFPEKMEVFDRSSEIIVRDFNFMSGLSIVQALLALIFYKACPQQLIAIVFSSDFIKRLEQEIAMCYSKNTYPQRVMNKYMQLNRAVCLDCPEVNVRWFQQSFMEAQASKAPVIQSRVHTEVRHVLLDIVKSPDYLKVNRVTPYGYRVDFELNIDQYNRFMKPLPEDYHHVNYNATVNKIAILLLSNKMLCDNDSHRLKGQELLRMRHLEMMGYRVIHVKINDFNSLYKNATAKINYLKNLMQLSA